VVASPFEGGRPVEEGEYGRSRRIQTLKASLVEGGRFSR
jgi:hypothetical protein